MDKKAEATALIARLYAMLGRPLPDPEKFELQAVTVCISKTGEIAVSETGYYRSPLAVSPIENYWRFVNSPNREFGLLHDPAVVAHAAGCVCPGCVERNRPWASTPAGDVKTDASKHIAPRSQHVAHQYASCKDSCPGCNLCGGGLSSCDICRGAEGSLTTSCPQRKLTDAELDLVYRGKLDFSNGMWIGERGVESGR